MAKLDESVLILGVPEVDSDHLRIDALFESVAQTDDSDLPELLDRIARELEDHFAREEKLMADRGVPLVECHRAQHRMILGEVAEMAKIASAAETRAFRRLMEIVLPQLVNAHIASIDRVAAAYLTGRLDDRDFEGLRLPAPESRN